MASIKQALKSRDPKGQFSPMKEMATSIGKQEGRVPHVAKITDALHQRAEKRYRAGHHLPAHAPTGHTGKLLEKLRSAKHSGRRRRGA